MFSSNLPPYLVRARKRPLRFAYVIDGARKGDSAFDGMIVQTLRWWGGRHTPIVFHDAGELSAEAWALLRAVSPDVVSSLDPLPDDLRRRIELELAPAAIQDDGKGHPFQGPLALPDRRVLDEIVRFRSTPELVLINRGRRDRGEVLSSFIGRNFGVYFTLPLPEDVKSLEFSVSTNEDLAEMLEQLANASFPVAYVSEVAAVPDVLPAATPGLTSFVVAIGDGLKDFSRGWNHLLFCSTRKRIQSVWIPVELATHPKVAPALGKWIERTCTRAHDDRALISFASESIAEADLAGIVANFGINPRRCEPAGASKRQSQLTPEGLHDVFRSSEVVHRGLQDREVIVVTPPASLHPLSSSGYWAADLLVEQQPVDDFYIRSQWWQLPKDPAVAECFVSPGRIAASTRVPTAIVRDKANELVLGIPDSARLFSCLLRQSVVRPSVRSRFSDCRPSDKGRYLTSLIELFGGVGRAAGVFETRFWRMVAAEMPTPGDKERAWTCDELMAKAKKEFAEFKRNEKRDDRFDRERFSNRIEEFIERSVFIVGIDRKCPGCEFSSWLRLEELRQLLACPGCGAASPFSVAQKIGLRLNSLVRRAWQHDVVPVLLALGQEIASARTSFRYAPQTDVFTQNEKDEAFTDIDILCVVDGDLVIGEAKQNFEGFGEKDFKNLSECAARLHPDRVVLFACGGTELPEFAVQLATLNAGLTAKGMAPAKVGKPYRGALEAAPPY